MSGLFFYSVAMPPRRKVRTSTPRDRVVIGLLCAMGVVAVACVVVLWLLSGLNNTPAWWALLDENPNITEQSGIELENGITTALTRLRPAGEEEWAVAIHQDQLNSWLTHRLRETVHSFSTDQDADRTIDQIGEVQIRIDPAGVTIGARISHAHGSTVVWAVIDLGVDALDNFTIDPQRVYVGGTRVPAGLASSYLTSENLGSASVDLGDGRIVRIRGIRANDQRLELALRTEMKE